MASKMIRLSQLKLTQTELKCSNQNQLIPFFIQPEKLYQLAGI